MTQRSLFMLIASIVISAILAVLSWTLVYYIVIPPLGTGLLESVLFNFNIKSTIWWNDFIRLLYSAVIIVLVVLLSWLALGHLVTEAREAGKWWYYSRSEEARKDVWVLRTNLWLRIQHMLFFLTFAISAITGFTLYYANNPLWHMLYINRDTLVLIHIFSGIVMGIVAILYISRYVTEAIIVKARGGSLRKRYPILELYSFKYLKMLGKDILRVLSDRFKKEPYHKYTTISLFTFWGGFFGAAIIGITGILMLMYNGPATLGGILWTIHILEAVLSTATLLVAHLAYVHFRPTIFPMDTVIIHGKMPLKRIKETHPLWAQELEAKLGEPGSGGR